MLIDQAIFTSADTNRTRGYHLIARSLGISATAAAELSRWSPSHNSLLTRELNAQSLNYHPLSDGRYVVSRTIHGGREFSQRGGWQVVTMSLVLKKEHLRRYDNNAIAIARVARSLGYLRWEPSMGSSLSLPQVELPDLAASESMGRNYSRTPFSKKAESALLENDSIVLLTDESNLLQAIESLLCLAASNQRLKISFTTGLKPAEQRPFRVHVMSHASADAQIRSKLNSLGLRCLTDKDHDSLPQG